MAVQKQADWVEFCGSLEHIETDKKEERRNRREREQGVYSNFREIGREFQVLRN